MDLENDFTLSPTESLHESDATSLISEKDLDFDTTDFQTERAKNFAKEQAKEPAKNSGFVANLDICFMLDCTSSMMSYIQRARDKIKEVIEEVKEQNPGSEIYVAIVGYRDISDTPRFEVLPFTCDIKEAKAFLDKLQALGGGDLPEDVNGGFQQALQLEWRSDAKMILHIADAPCHGKGFHNFDCGDTYPDGYKEDADWEAIFEQIVAYRIDYLFLKIIPTNTDLMFEKFKEMGERFGALEHGVLFKQEPISLVDAMANNGVAYPVMSKLGLCSVAMPVFEKRKRGRPRKNAAKEDVKEKPTTRGRKKKEESVKRDRSTSKDREREEERAKSSTAWGKLGVPGLPPGMTALEEQEYFAKLLSKEMTATIHRKRDAKK